MTEPLYYAKGMEVWESPVRTKIEGGESVTLGFHACTASEVVGEEGATAIAALLCLGEEAQASPKDIVTVALRDLLAACERYDNDPSDLNMAVYAQAKDNARAALHVEPPEAGQ